MIQTQEGKILTLRASSLDLAWKCGASAAPLTVEGEEVKINQPHEITELGNAFHAWAAFIDDEENRPDVADVAARFGVDEDELGMLVALGMKQWHEHLAKWLDGGASEHEYEYEVEFPYHGYSRLRIRGKLDKHKAVGNRVFTNDWKSGYLEGDHEHQQRAYALLALSQHPEAEQVWSGLSYVRLGFIDAKFYTKEELRQWLDDLIWRIRNGLDTFNPGPHCMYCQRQHSCAARDQFAASAIRTFNDGLPGEMTGENMALWLRTAKFVQAEINRFREIAKERVARDGFIDCGDGRIFELSKSTIRGIDPRRAWPILSRHLSEDELAPAVKVSKGKVEKAIAAKADKGQKGKQIQAVMDELDNAGALVESTRTELREVKADVN